MTEFRRDVCHIHALRVQQRSVGMTQTVHRDGRQTLLLLKPCQPRRECLTAKRIADTILDEEIRLLIRELSVYFYQPCDIEDEDVRQSKHPC